MNIKKITGFIANEFVYGGHLLSLGAASIVFTSSMLLDIKITWDFLVIAYLVVYISYAFNRLREFDGDFLSNPLRTRHVEKCIVLLPYSVLFSFLVILLLLAEFGNFNSFVLVLFMVVGSLLYTIFFKNLTKNIIGFKSLYVALFWALLVVLLILYFDVSLGLPAFLMAAFVFLRLAVNTVFFDIKDMAADRRLHLKTLPVFLGRKRVVILIHILNILSFVPLTIGVYTGYFPPAILSMLFFYFYTFYYLLSVGEDSINLQKLSYAMVDGEYILWPIVLLYFNL